MDARSRGLLGAVLVVWATSARAQDLDDRQLFSDALLQEAAYGDIPGAVRTYEALARRLADDDPLRGDVLFALGRAHWSTGRVDAARTWLLEGIRTGVCPTRCRDLLERVELEAAQITTLPLTWTFDDGSEHALFHPWRFQDRGSLRAAAGTLEWRTTPDRRQPDRLVMGIGDVGRVTSLTLKLASVSRDMRLQLVAVTDDGLQYGLRDALRVPAGRPFTATVTPKDFVPVAEGPPLLDDRAIAELWLVDISDEGEPLVVVLDALTLR